MKLWRTLCACALAVTVLCCGAAYAAETEEFMIQVPDVHCDERDWQNSVSLFETAEWNTGNIRYGDQLQGMAAETYQKLETSFNGQDTKFTQQIVRIAADGTTDIKSYISLNEIYTVSIEVPAEKDYNVIADDWFSSNKSEIFGAMFAFTYDHPEYFWIRTNAVYGGSYGFNSDENTVQCILEVRYVLSKDCDEGTEIELMQDHLKIALTNALNARDKSSDMAELAFFDNWLAANNVYNDAAVETEEYIETDATPWNVIGGLVSESSPVCEGYAKSLKLLCDQVGIPCITVSGTANGGGHMWNAVKLDGTWYFCDPTWDDGGNESDRTHFLTAQPSTHSTDASPATPTLSTSGYFTDFAFAESALSGSEVGTNAHWIALYDDKGKLLDAQPCPSFYWKNGETMYVAPEFSSKILSGAQTAKRFVFDEKWIPQDTKLVLISAA